MRARLERWRSLLDFALRALARRRMRTAGLLLAYVALVFVVASVMLLGGALRAEAARRLQGAPAVTVQRLVLGRHDLSPASDVEAARQVRGVLRAEGRLWGYFYDTLAETTLTLMVPPPDSGLALEPGRVVLGPGVARLKASRPEDAFIQVAPSGQVLASTVQAVLSPDEALVGEDLVLLPEGDFRDFFQLGPGLYTDLALTVRNPQEVDTVVRKLAQALPQSRILTRRDLLRTYQVSFDWREGFLLTPLLAAMLAFALLAWDKASGLSAEEAREIGVLKAVGWDTRDVLVMKLGEGLVLSLAAFLLGYLAAYAHVFLAGAPLLAPVLGGWSGLASPLWLRPTVDEVQLLGLAFFTVVPYLAATLVPIWAAASSDPDEVLR